MAITPFGISVAGGLIVPDASPFVDIPARDAWASANPQLLLKNRTMVVVTSTGLWYLWNGSAWIESTPLVTGPAGRDGVDGTSLEFATVAERDAFFSVRKDLLRPELPITVNIGGNSVTQQIWIGPSNPAVYSTEFWILASIRSGAASFELADIHSLSSGGENAFFKNKESGITWFPAWQGVGDHSTPAGRFVYNTPSARQYGAFTFDEVVGAVATSGSVDYNVPVTLVRNESVYGIKVVAAETYVGRIDYEIIRTPSNRKIYAQTLNVNLSPGSVFEFWFDFPAENKTGTSFMASLKKPDGSYLKVRPIQTNPAIAYVEIRFREFEDKVMALFDDVVRPVLSYSDNLTINTLSLFNLVNGRILRFSGLTSNKVVEVGQGQFDVYYYISNISSYDVTVTPLSPVTVTGDPVIGSGEVALVSYISATNTYNVRKIVGKQVECLTIRPQGSTDLLPFIAKAPSQYKILKSRVWPLNDPNASLTATLIRNLTTSIPGVHIINSSDAISEVTHNTVLYRGDSLSVTLTGMSNVNGPVLIELEYVLDF